MRCSLALVVAFALSCPASAFAHGRPPFIGDLAFHPTDPMMIVGRATWGLAVSEDGGETWRWLCAAVTGADPTREDPPILVMPDRSILLGTFGGIARSTPDHCSFTFPEELRDQYVIDVDTLASEPGTVVAVATSGTDPDQIYRSVDQGQTWAPLGDPIQDVLVERVRVAPSDASRVYLSGAIPMQTTRIDAGPIPDGGMPEGGLVVMTPRQGLLLRSRDGGETYERVEVPLVRDERNVHLLAVDPTNPDRLMVRMTRRSVDTRRERVLLSEDGGDTWSTATEVRIVSGGAFSADGTEAYVSSTDVDGLFRSDDGGASFTQAQPGDLTCVAVHGDQLWTCHNERTAGFAIGLSPDRGVTSDPRLYWSDIGVLVDCASCTAVGHVCPLWFPDVAYDLALDGSTVPDGGATGRPRDAGPLPGCEPPPDEMDTCGCSAVRSRPIPARWLTVLLFGSLLRLVARRRRRR